MSSDRGDALGMVETLAMVPSLVSADKMLKAANVTLEAFEAGGSTLCTVFVRGDVASCRHAVEAGWAAAGRIGTVTAKNVLPRPVPEIETIVNIHSFGDQPELRPLGEALGLIETFGVVYLLSAADAMCKAAAVELIGYENIYDGYVSVLVSGDTEACRSAVKVGVSAVEQLGGKVYSSVVIQSPHPELAKIANRYTLTGWQ